MNKKENIGFFDIGMFCNQIDMLCRSSNAFCSNGKMINNVYLSPQCVCQDGYLPVYQDYLDYYECNHQSSIFMRNTNITHFIVFISNQFNSLYPYDACLLSMFKEGIWCKIFNFSKNDDILTRCASIQFDHKKKEFTFKTYIIVLYQSVFDYVTKDIQNFISFTSYWNEENITLDSKEINCLIYSPESINEIKFHSNDLSTYGNFTIPLNKYTSVSSMKSLTEADSSQLNSDLMGIDSNENFTVTSELHINCVFRVCQHIRWCVWPSYCNGHMRSLDHDLHQSDLSWSYTYPSILTLTKSLKIKISNSNSISPSLYSSPHSPAFKNNESINSICEPNNNIFIKFSTNFIILIICLVTGIIFTLFYYHYNTLTCQPRYNQCCRTFHRWNHKKLTNNQLVTYNLCSNPLNTKVLQSPVDEADTSDHSLNSILQENSHQLHQYSSLKYLESNCSMITQHDLIHHKKDHQDHDQFDLNKNYKHRLSSSTDLQQQQQRLQQKSIFVPYCLHNQTLCFLQSDWNNIDKQENSFKSINTTDYTYFSNNFYDLSNSVKVKTDSSNYNHDEQEFNV
ncbi:hypothetical protein Smp_131330 [Schistosoma mansoni]|uniref:hypothetical protein n=1 Tax=Schistosoma mansoni TaxID=6183 RepID=UPI00022DC45C|nr:hypothetical protein Smp_131330 [Schistosoma mansoni]|eukprot:XP_018653379.1 hypothetical protein Smp_131330 [Schistosoma mansoni]